MLFRERWFYGFYACGGFDEVFAEKYPWRWETIDFNDSGWLLLNHFHSPNNLGTWSPEKL